VGLGSNLWGHDIFLFCFHTKPNILVILSEGEF
jgi:hypothetical protein